MVTRVLYTTFSLLLSPFKHWSFYERKDKTKFFKERGWGRQAPSAGAVNEPQEPNTHQSGASEAPSAPDWLINIRKRDNDLWEYPNHEDHTHNQNLCLLHHNHLNHVVHHHSHRSFSNQEDCIHDQNRVLDHHLNHIPNVSPRHVLHGHLICF